MEKSEKIPTLVQKTGEDMDIQVAEHLAPLLYENDTLILPGFGAFVAQTQAAEVDAIQGRVDAPAKTVDFNSNLVLDDGILVGHLQKTYSISPPAARDIVAKYVSEVRQGIEKGEIIEISNIGRFYQDYEKRLRFLPDDNNFNKQAYGLPSLNFYPLARNERPTTLSPTVTVEAPPQPNTNKTRSDLGVSKELSDWFQRNLSWLAAASLVFFAMVIYLIYLRPDPIQNDPVANVPKDRLNVSPPVIVPKESDNTLDLGEADPLEEEDIIGPGTVIEPADTEAPTLSPNQKSAVIAVGMFGEERNVQAMIKRVYSAGYEPYTGREGKLTRVGVRVAYDTERELASHLRRVKRKLEQSAFVMEDVE